MAISTTHTGRIIRSGNPASKLIGITAIDYVNQVVNSLHLFPNFFFRSAVSQRSRTSSFALNRFGSKALKTKFRNYRLPACKRKRCTLHLLQETWHNRERERRSAHVCTVCTRVCELCRGSDEFGKTRKRCIIQRTESRNFNKRKIRLATRSWDTRLSPGRKYLRKILHSLSGSLCVGMCFRFIYVFMSSEWRREKRNSARNKRTLMIFRRNRKAMAKKMKRSKKLNALIKPRHANYSITFHSRSFDFHFSLRRFNFRLDFFSEVKRHLENSAESYEFLNSRGVRSSTNVPETRGISDADPPTVFASRTLSEVLGLAHELTTCGRADSRREWISRATLSSRMFHRGISIILPPTRDRQSFFSKIRSLRERRIFSHTQAITIPSYTPLIKLIEQSGIIQLGKDGKNKILTALNCPDRGSLKKLQKIPQQRQNIDESRGGHRTRNEERAKVLPKDE